MIVITLTDCPPALRGDLTKWLQEIDTGVYVGKTSARVRDELWNRIQENAKSGRAVMVFNANNEQGMDFRVHNTAWGPIDFDGLKLILRPSAARTQKLTEKRMGFSNAAKMHMARKMGGRGRQSFLSEYIAIDLKTTGPSPKEDEIIEIAGSRVSDSKIIKEHQSFIETKKRISDDMETLEGRNIENVMADFLAFAENLPIVSYNADFVYGFLRIACEKCGLPLFSNKCVDTLTLARRAVDEVENYELSTLLEHFKIEPGSVHNALDACRTIKQLYEKLIEMR